MLCPNSASEPLRMSMNSMSAGIRVPQTLGSKPNWLTKTTLMLRDWPGDVREDVIRLVFQQIRAILPQLVAAAHLLVHADPPAVHAVVGELHVYGGEIRAEETHFLERVIPDGEDVVAEARGLDQCV